MKTSKAIIMIVIALAMNVTPTFAQRIGTNRSTVSSSSRSSSSSSSRSTVSSPSRSSSSSSSRSTFSSSSRSSSSSSSRSTDSSPSRSSSSSSSRSTVSSPIRSTNNSSNRSMVNSPSRSSSNNFSRTTTTSSPKSTTDSRSRYTTGGSPSIAGMGRSAGGSRIQPAKANINHSRERMIQKRRTYTAGLTSNSKQTRSSGFNSSTQPKGSSNFVYSPHGNRVLKMNISSTNAKSSPRQIYRTGLWDKCSSNWYGNHTTNKSNVQSFASQQYNVNIIDYGFCDGILYCISEDSKGVFLQACDKDGKVLDEQKINRGYKTIVITEENSGCWITKEGDKDPLYYSFDGKYLMKYDYDEGKEIIDYNFCERVQYTITRENHHTYFQIYSDNNEHPLASSEINDCFNTVDVEPADCRCFIKNTENGQATEVIWLGDEIMFDEGK